MGGKDGTSSGRPTGGRRCYSAGVVDTAGPSDLELVRAMLANWEALERAIAERFGGAVEDDARGFRFRSGLHSGFLNGVLRTHVDADDVLPLAHEVRRWFPDGLPWRWIVGPGVQPHNLAFKLEADGFERRWPQMPAMTIELADLPDRDWTPEGGRVTEVTSAADLESWLSVRRVNLGLDDQTIAAWRRAHGEFGLGPESALRHFVGWLGGRPVAGATMFLDETGTAGIYHVDVLAEARGRGFGKAVTAVALADARRLGYRLGVLSASTLGTPVYLRLGFRIVGEVTIFVGGGH
jgi:ribosomal protein S18 acetylase RimI-like enzyme